MTKWKPTVKDLERWKPVVQRVGEIEGDLAENVNYAGHPDVDLPVEAEIHLHYDKKKLILIKKLREKLIKLNSREQKKLKKVM